jgi:hypothetical protein
MYKNGSVFNSDKKYEAERAKLLCKQQDLMAERAIHKYDLKTVAINQNTGIILGLNEENKPSAYPVI